MAKRRSIHYLFALILLVFTFAICEVSFRAYDHVTSLQDNLNMDVWIKKISKEVEEHPLLGYRRVPKQVVDNLTQADEFGMLNERESLAWDKVDVVGIGDSYIELTSRTFFERCTKP